MGHFPECMIVVMAPLLLFLMGLCVVRNVRVLRSAYQFICVLCLVILALTFKGIIQYRYIEYYYSSIKQRLTTVWSRIILNGLPKKVLLIWAIWVKKKVNGHLQNSFLKKLRWRVWAGSPPLNIIFKNVAWKNN